MKVAYIRDLELHAYVIFPTIDLEIYKTLDGFINFALGRPAIHLYTHCCMILLLVHKLPIHFQSYPDIEFLRSNGI